jgi:hypothetical protein
MSKADTGTDAPNPFSAAPGVVQTTTEERNLALLAHLSLLAHLLVPIVALVAPIIIWQTKKDSSPFVTDHAREAVNFYISLFIYSIAAVVLGILTCGIGMVAMAFPVVLGIIGMILACVAANKSQLYRYPMTIRLLK